MTTGVIQKDVSEAVEYGGFVMNNETSNYDLLFTTFISELLCRNRALERAKQENETNQGRYDLNDILIKTRKVVTYGWNT